ncbi:MAG: primosomal replication protein N [Azoarcus sp.]|nr:primosomal replication protein N [Azoarcus sp.]
MGDGGTNALSLLAQIVELSPLRHSPAGVPVASCVLAHESRQIEAGLAREVKVTLSAVALGELARVLAASRPGAWIAVKGFLVAKSAKSKVPVLHLNQIDFVEGN